MSEEDTSEIRSIIQGHMRKYFGSSPEEIQETYKVLEGLTPAEIREAVKLYREKREHGGVFDISKSIEGEDFWIELKELVLKARKKLEEKSGKCLNGDGPRSRESQ